MGHSRRRPCGRNGKCPTGKRPLRHCLDCRVDLQVGKRTQLSVSAGVVNRKTAKKKIYSLISSARMREGENSCRANWWTLL